MSKPAPKGWCPSARRPMASGDGLLLRPHIRHGDLSAPMARAIAQLAQRHGNSQIDLTQRGNLQIRGVTPERYETLLHELDQLGIADAPPAAIIASPLAGLDPDCAPGLWAIADAVQAQLADLVLPAKFLCLLDGGGAWPLHLPADLHCRPPFAADAIAAAIRQAVQQPKRDKSQAAPSLARPGYLDRLSVLAVAPAFGSLHAEALALLADLSQAYGNGRLRLAPWRLILLPGLNAAGAEIAAATALQAGFIVAANDPRRSIQVCPGAPACASALGDTRLLATRLAPLLPDDSGLTHIAGCAKGCAHPGPARRMIVARGNNQYSLKHDATADAAAMQGALSPEDLIRACTA